MERIGRGSGAALLGTVLSALVVAVVLVAGLVVPRDGEWWSVATFVLVIAVATGASWTRRAPRG